MSLLVAVFNQRSERSGKTVSYEDAQRQFILQDHGPITAQALLGYDAQGQLDWADEGLREWAQKAAQAAAAPAHSAAGRPSPTVEAAAAPSQAMAGAEPKRQAGRGAQGAALTESFDSGPVPAADDSRPAPEAADHERFEPGHRGSRVHLLAGRFRRPPPRRSWAHPLDRRPARGRATRHGEGALHHRHRHRGHQHAVRPSGSRRASWLAPASRTAGRAPGRNSNAVCGQGSRNRGSTRTDPRLQPVGELRRGPPGRAPRSRRCSRTGCRGAAPGERS